MKITLAAVALVAAFALPKPEAVAVRGEHDWTVDGVHSSVLFKVKHAGASWFYGMFKGIRGTITLDPAKPEQGSVRIEIDAGSVDTRDEKRDQHLRGPDFFDSKQFPSIVFESKSIQKAEKALKVEGELDLHGVQKRVEATVALTGTGEFYGKRQGFEATFVIKRSDFGMDYGLANSALGDEVHLTVAIEAVQPQEKGK